MGGIRIATVPLLAGLLLVPALPAAAQARGGAEKVQPPKVQTFRNVPPNPNDKYAGDRILIRLSQMTPEELEQELSALPPPRREQIEERIRKFQQLPPAQQARNLDRLQRLNSLSPLRQEQVRLSMKQLNELPQEQKKQFNQVLRRITPMRDEERRAFLDSDEFRSRYSLAEQQMLVNLAELLPSSSK
jgi:hypothetical protein